MDKKRMLARLFDTIGATRLILGVRRRAPSPWLPILTFHRISERGAPCMLDDCVVNATRDEFDRQMATVQRYFEPVGIDDLVRYAEGGTLPRNAILITFDDGYRDNYELALPVLQRRGMKAVFFVATSYISERRLFWWDRVNYLVKSSKRSSLELAYPVPLRLDTSDAQARRAAITSLLRVVKSARSLDLPKLLDELQRATGSDWSTDLERQLADEHLMSWHQVRALRAAGMEVQSHTRTHRVLQTLEDAQILDELRGSREDLERELGEPISAISYPVGYGIADRAFIREALTQAGYKIAFKNAGGVQWVTDKLDRFQVDRISVCSQCPEALFRAMLAVPPLFI
jgi:peptidoglycan/xylan/chitin deacetylase (PgdA/CDA1 family)